MNDNDLLARVDDVANAFCHGLLFRLVEGDTELGEFCQELRVVRLLGIGLGVPVNKRLVLPQRSLAIRDVDRDLGSDLWRQIQNLVLGAAKHDLLHEEVQLIEVRRPGRDPAVVVPVGLAILLGEGQERPRRRMPHAAEQVKQVPGPVGQRRACEQEDEIRAQERRFGRVLTPSSFRQCEVLWLLFFMK